MSNIPPQLSVHTGEVRKAPPFRTYTRYPGPRSFTDNGVDQRLFFGREQETEELFHRVRASRLLVLFGKSGLGKTSLLQAGLYPRFRERALLPVPVRFNHPVTDPVVVILQSLQEHCQEQGIEFNPPQLAGLWEVFKVTDFWKGEVLWTPVLIFDQFEEIFTLQSESVRTSIATVLGELAFPGFPARIRQRLNPKEGLPFSDSLPDVKLILSLREEYVGALEQLVPNVPFIFERRFQLCPMTQKVARKAIVQPASVDAPVNFSTCPFSYKEATLNTIMEFLVNRQGEVEPFQLQIICQYVEQQVAQCQRKGQKEVEVDREVLGGREAMEGLIQNFYCQAIQQLPAWSLSRRRAQLLCERGLLSPTGHRVSMEEGQIQKQYKLQEGSLNKLTEARLLRKESRPGLNGFYYELSHDCLTEPVRKNRGLREKVIKIAIGLVTLISIGCGFLAISLLGKANIQARSFEDAYKKSNLAILEQGGRLEPMMKEVPIGSFRMGEDQAAQRKDKTQHFDERPVREVTFEEYDQFSADVGKAFPEDMGWGRGRRPVINVSWQDAKNYANWLSEKTGRPYRLPTEAEWEYVARSGEKQEIWAGTSDERQLGNYSVYEQNSGGQTDIVGSKQPNDLGFYDMSGNVREWVEDCLHETYEGAPSDGTAWRETGGGYCDLHVARGGSWISEPEDLRTSGRYRVNATIKNDLIGFRLAQDIP